MVSFLRLHRWKLLALAFAANLGLQLYLAAGDLRPWAEIKWNDVVGEGGSALLTLGWYYLLLNSRPAGRVTNLLAFGLGCMFLSFWLDCADEFVVLPPAVQWDNWLESVPMPIGLLVLTVGLYHWHHEQRAIGAHLEKRERLFREHALLDKLIPLGAAGYLRKQLEWVLAPGRGEQPVSLVAVDIDGFGRINDRYGDGEGDHLLQAVSQLLLLNLRRDDLICRLAGDRFVVLLPRTGEREAQRIAAELTDAVSHFAYRCRTTGERLALSVTCAVMLACGDSAEALLARLNGRLGEAKAGGARLSAETV